MKKLVVLCLALALCLICLGCGGGKGDVPQEMDMDAVYETFCQTVTLPQMLELSESERLDYCGIRSENVRQAKVFLCADSLRADEIWLIEANDEDAAKDLEALAQKRLEKKGEESITYSPEQYAVVEKAECIRRGRFLALLVSPDSADLAEAFRQAS